MAAPPLSAPSAPRPIFLARAMRPCVFSKFLTASGFDNFARCPFAPKESKSRNALSQSVVPPLNRDVLGLGSINCVRALLPRNLEPRGNHADIRALCQSPGPTSKFSAPTRQHVTYDAEFVLWRMQGYPPLFSDAANLMSAVGSAQRQTCERRKLM